MSRLPRVLLLTLPLLTGAAPPLQSPTPNALADWMAAQWNTLVIEGMKAIATLCWFLEKAAAGITRFLTDQNMWELIINSTLTTLAGFMPDVLQNLVLGAAGLFYVALMLAGIFMILPNVSTARLVDRSRVVVWGTILAALFITGTLGYDLIGYAEEVRAYAAQAVIAEASRGDDLDSLVAVPMRATDGDLNDYGFTLPVAYEAEFFPAPTEFEERVVFDLGGPFLTWQWVILVETPESQQMRRSQAETGLAIAGLTLVAGWALLLLGLIFATLTAAAIVLIIFFVVALPLGFFEFGASILAGIVRQYAYLFAVTLLAVGLAGILASAGWVAFSGPTPGPSELMGFIPVLIIVGIATGYVMGMASRALTGTLGVVSTSIQRAFSPLAYAGGMPTAGGIPGASTLSTAASLAMTAGGAAMTGGTALAATAVAGSALHAMSASAGQGAASIARAAGTSTNNQVFATAASGLGAARTTATAVRHNRQERDREERAASGAYRSASMSASQLPPRMWEGALDAGGYLTPDMRLIEEAEVEHGAGNRVTARRHLRAAFGDLETGDAALALYDAGEASRVRKVVQTTQAVASDLAGEGHLPFDTRGRATPLYQERLRAALRSEQLVPPVGSPITGSAASDSALIGRIAGATIRRPIGVWQAPDAPRQLAQHVLDDEAGLIPGADLSAQFKLRDLATHHGWSETQLEGLFDATRQGLSTAVPEGMNPRAFAAEQLNRQGEWQHVPMVQKVEAVSSALLIAESAQFQQAVGITPPPPTTPSNAATTEEGPDSTAMGATTPPQPTPPEGMPPHAPPGPIGNTGNGAVSAEEPHVPPVSDPGPNGHAQPAQPEASSEEETYS